MTEHDGPHDEQSGGAGAPGPAREHTWDDVAAQFSNLGKQIRSAFERSERSAPGDSTAPGSAPGGPVTGAPGPGGTTSEGQPVSGRGNEGVRRWIDSFDETFTRLGDTVRDPAFREQAGSSVNRLGVALGATLREFGEQMQDRFGGKAGEQAQHGEPVSDVPPQPPPPSPPAAPSPEASGSADPVPPTTGANGPSDPPPTPPSGEPAPPTAPGADDQPSADDRPPTT